MQKPPPPKPVVKPAPPPPVFPLQAFQAYVDLLNNEPDFLLGKAERVGDLGEIIAARTPVSRNPQLLRQQAGLDAKWVEESWTEVASDHPEFVKQRIRNVLKAVPSLSLLSLDSNKRLLLDGSANKDELDEMTGRLLDLPDVVFVGAHDVELTP